MEKNNLSPIHEKHSSERAFEQIHRANSFIRIVTIVALIVMVVLLAYTLIRVNQLTTQYQEEAEQRGLYNRELLEQLTKSSKQTQYLICQVVTVTYEDRQPPKEFTDICGPILKAGPDGETSFLDQGSETANNSGSQPALGPLANSNPNQNSQNNNPATVPPTTSQPPNGGGDDNTNTPPPNENPNTQPGLVETLQGGTNRVLCTAQQLLLNQCIIRL